MTNKEHVYIISHKAYTPLSDIDKDLYKDMVVGASLGNRGNEGAIYDNVGKNISAKNRSFCELTGLYWMCNNTDDEILGLVHYRRFFMDKGQILDKTELNKILKKYDLILPVRDPLIFLGYNADQFFGLAHDPLIWTLCRDVISEIYPKYIVDFDWFSKQTTGYSYNMFIGKSNIVKEYSAWLFNILFELEKKVDLSKYNSYNQRMLGFVSERLFNVWVHNKKLKIKELPVKFMENQSTKTKLINFINNTRARRRLNNKRNA